MKGSHANNSSIPKNVKQKMCTEGVTLIVLCFVPKNDKQEHTGALKSGHRGYAASLGYFLLQML